MSKRNIADEWKLEGSNQPQQQWVLEEAEQKALGPWQLQDQPQVAIEWQPIDYVRERRGGGANWILPTFVGIALVGAMAYAGWVVLNRTGMLGAAVPAPPVATVETPGTEATATPLPTPVPPTATPPPPTPTLAPPTPTPTLAPPTPTVIPMVELVSGVITADNGVNARSDPSLDGQVIRVVNKDEKFLVASEQPEWVQVALGPGELAWVTAEYVQKSSERVQLDAANQRRSAVGLPPLTASTGISPSLPISPAAAITAPTAVTATVAVTGNALLTQTAPIATGRTPTVTTPTIEATIAITSGLNARSSPDLAANNVVRLLASGETHPVVARSPDNKWVQLRLKEDGRLAWVAAEYVTLSGDLNAIPAEQPTSAGPTAPLSVITTTTGITATQGVTTAVKGASGVTATIVNLSGSNARSTPDDKTEPLLTLPFDSVLSVVGKSVDGDWIKVTLEGNQQAWVWVEEVQITGDIATLPIVK